MNPRPRVSQRRRTRRHAPRVWPYAMLLASALALPAHAQPVDWWMTLPYGVRGQQGPETRAAEQLEQALKDRRVPVMAMHQAADAFDRNSREPMDVDPTDIDLLAKDAYEAVRQVAFGNRQAATRTVARVMQRAERAMESLNRETKNARYVLDACLALVRSTMSRGDREDALAEAMRCRRVVPDVTPSEMMHPPSVIGVLAEADDQLRRMQIGQLEVESVPETGCSVYLNGRHLGTTPFRLRRAAAGEYRVQVECGDRPGRVHLVTLGPEPVKLRVDTVFDQSVRSEPSLSLRYRSLRTASQRVVQDALRVARDTGAYEVLLVSAESDRLVRVQRVAQDSDRVLAEVTLPWRQHDFAPSALDAGLDALLAGRSTRQEEEEGVAPAPPPAPVVATPPPAKTVAPQPVPVAQVSVAEPEPQRPRLSQRQRQLRVGLPLAAAGVAGLATGWAFYAIAHSRLVYRDALPPVGMTAPQQAEINRRAQAYEDVRRLPTIAFAGGALATAALPWLLPETEALPWYAWVVGGAGVGMAAVGFWQLGRNGDCTLPMGDTCLRREDTLPLMSVSFATALPLLAVPATFALRMPFARGGDARLGATSLAGGAALTFFGRF